MSQSTSQDDWEEFPEDEVQVSEEPGGLVNTSPGTLRKRTQPKGHLFSSPSRSSRDRKTAPKRPKLSPESKPEWTLAVSSAFLFTVNYVLEVLRFALVMLRKPLSLILVGYFLAVMMSHLRTTIGAALYPTVVTLCQLPGISRLTVCKVPNLTELAQRGVQRADYPSLVDIESGTFEQLLDNSIGGASLALEIKKAEMATIDLTTLVRISHLTSKDRMADTLTIFVEDARRTGRGLQKFSAKVGGAVDRIIAVNDYALRRIEEAASESSYPSLLRAVLSPFSLQPSYANALTTSFKLAMSLLESELHMLILAAEASLHDLDSLEEQLNLVHTMVVREDDSVSVSKQELLSKLWTVVGGNRAELRRYDTHLKLLGGLADYRKKALAHVVGALQTLQAMSADLEALRERVSQPVLADSESVPLELHVKSIRTGLERLTEGRIKAKKLEDARYAKLAESLGV